MATKPSQKLVRLEIASLTEPVPPPFLGARPYQTISVHRAPADVPLKPTSSNRFLSRMSLRISVRTPTSKAACIPPPWQATATFMSISYARDKVLMYRLKDTEWKG